MLMYTVTMKLLYIDVESKEILVKQVDKEETSLLFKSFRNELSCKS